MGYLLVVLAVVLVPVVAHNQSHVPSPTSSCPAAVDQVSSQVDQLIKGLFVLNKQVYRIESRLDRFELNLLVLKYQLNMNNQTIKSNDRLERRVDQLQEQLNQLENTALQEKACARATVAEGLPLTLTINQTARFSVLARDCKGCDLSTGGDNVTATLTSVDYPSCVSPEPTVVDNGDGSYQVSLTPECCGNNLVSVSINGKTIKDLPVTVAVIPPYTSLRLKRTITSVNHPYGFAFTENGDVFIGSWFDHHVHHFDRNGNKLNSWRIPGNSIHDVLIHGKNIYVAQCHPGKVYNYTLNGTLVGSVFTDNCYVNLIIGPDGRMYASHWGQGLISIFNMEDGSLFHQITGAPRPRGLGFDLDGNLHVSRWESPVIQVFTRSGVLLRSYTVPSAGHIDFLFIDKAGNMLVADRGASPKVIIVDKNNNLLHKLIPGPGHTTVDVGVAPNGDVWVANYEAKLLIYSV